MSFIGKMVGTVFPGLYGLFKTQKALEELKVIFSESAGNTEKEVAVYNFREIMTEMGEADLAEHVGMWWWLNDETFKEELRDSDPGDLEHLTKKGDLQIVHGGGEKKLKEDSLETSPEIEARELAGEIDSQLRKIKILIGSAAVKIQKDVRKAPSNMYIGKKRNGISIAYDPEVSGVAGTVLSLLKEGEIIAGLAKIESMLDKYNARPVKFKIKDVKNRIYTLLEAKSLLENGYVDDAKILVKS